MAGKYALIIACSEYQDERLHRLPKTEADTAGMRRVLIDERLCGFPTENVDVLLNEDERTVRIATERFFKQRNRNDLVLFYYAGHGIVDDERRLAFALGKTDLEFLSTAIDAEWLRKEMGKCRAKQQILILDCCNSGAFAHPIRDGASPAGIKEVFEAEGRYVLTASDRLQFSFEDWEKTEQIKNGLFTHYLLEGLESFAAAEAGGEVITVDSLFEYAREQVSAATAHKQTPLLFVWDKQARLELARREKPGIPAELQHKLVSGDHRERLLAVYDLKALALERGLTETVRTRLQEALTQERDYAVREAIGHCLRDLDRDSGVSAPGVPANAEALRKDALEVEYKPLAVFQDTLKSGEKGPDMGVIPAGEFQMGSPLSEPERSEAEGPQHRVRIERPFAIGKYAVTFDEYDAFVEATGREKPGDEGWGRGRRPVINVSWEDATAYAKWLSEQTGQHYRLPSEAEWEYAARAGTATPFHTGEQITTEQANFDGNYTYNGSAKGEYREKTVEVGNFPANAFGLHDVHGNVSEWVQDCWHDNYKGAPDDGSVWECESESGKGWLSKIKGLFGQRRSLRGGSWYVKPGRLRSAERFGRRPAHRLSDGGFRLVCGTVLRRLGGAYLRLDDRLEGKLVEVSSSPTLKERDQQEPLPPGGTFRLGNIQGAGRDNERLKPLKGVMFNAYPDSIGRNLADIVSMLKRPELKGVFSLFYILPTFFNSDLDRGFSVIDYNLNEELVSGKDLEELDKLNIMLKFDLVLNHLSVGSPQFQDILEYGDDSQYKDFFIDWNEFWRSDGEMGDDGYVMPKEEHLQKLFMRKPGLPILKVRFPDGSDRPYWNTFYQEVTYQEIVPEDLTVIKGIAHKQAQAIAGIVNEAIKAKTDISEIDLGRFSSHKDDVVAVVERKRQYLGQMDLNAQSEQVWDFFDETLKKMRDYGAKLVRLDAFAYLHKQPGMTNFFNKPGTWDYLERLKQIAEKYDLIVLPEIHSEWV